MALSFLYVRITSITNVGTHCKCVEDVGGGGQKQYIPLRIKCTPKLGIFTLNRPKLTELCLPVPSVCTIFNPIFILGQ